MTATKFSRLAGRVPERVRHRVPARLRAAVTARLGRPVAPFDPTAHPRRVNVGCGYDKRPGYLNVDLHDFHDPDLVADVRSLPSLPGGFYEEVVAQDVLEHLARADGPVALAEWRRLLAPGGRLWLRVPDLPSLLRKLERSDEPEHQRQVMHFLFGTQAYDGDFHLSGYTGVTLADELMGLGLERICGELRDEWLWEIEAFAPGGAPGMQPGASVLWGPGFHRREPHREGVLRWSEGTSELLIYASAAAEAEFALAVETGTVTLAGAGVNARLEPGEHSVRLELAPGANRLHFTSADRLEAEGDPRDLAFRLSHAALGGWTVL